MATRRHKPPLPAQETGATTRMRRNVADQISHQEGGAMTESLRHKAGHSLPPLNPGALADCWHGKGAGSQAQQQTCRSRAKWRDWVLCRWTLKAKIIRSAGMKGAYTARPVVVGSSFEACVAMRCRISELADQRFPHSGTTYYPVDNLPPSPSVI